MANKITKKDNYVALRALAVDAERPDLVEFVDHELELLSKKNASRNGKPTKSATETAEVAEVILANMPAGTKMTVTEIQKSIPALAEKSNQRMTAAIKVLEGTGFLRNVTEKGKSYYEKI